MLDLNTLPAYYIEKYGLQKIAEVVGKSTSLVAMQRKRNKTPLDDVSKLLSFDPEPLNTVKPLYSNPSPGNKLAILLPLSGPPEPKFMDCLLKLYDPKEMWVSRRSFNNLHVVRNSLAAEFLRSTSEWGFWPDGDMIFPCGDAVWYKQHAEIPDMPDIFAGINTIYRLLVHRKSMVSCSYVGRKAGAPPQFGGDAQVNRSELRRGPQAKVIERPWCGFGGGLTHRSVFDDIVKTQGDEIRMPAGSDTAKRFNYEYAFFHPLAVDVPGDDIPFCHRAKRAGHKVYVDLAVQAAHIGDRAFTYKDV